MNKFIKNKTPDLSGKKFVSQISSFFEAEKYQFEDLGNSFLTTESLSPADETALETASNAFQDEVQKTDLFKHLKSQADNPKFALTTESYNHAVNVAVMSMAAAVDQEASLKALVESSGTVDKRFSPYPVANHTPNISDFLTNEGYDPASGQSWKMVSAYANVMGVLQGDFEETFYPTFVQDQNSGGVNIPVTLPSVYRNLQRGNNGKVTSFEKSTIIEAYRDSNILQMNSTKIVPNVANDATCFVDAALVPNTVVDVEGIGVTTRPLVYGTKVDVINVSRVAALGHTYNETDALDRVIYLDALSFQLESGGNTVSAVMNVPKAPGALFTATQEGSTRDYQLTFTSENLGFNVAAAGAVVVGSATAFQDQVLTDLGGAAGDTIIIHFDVRVHGIANTENGGVVVDAPNLTIVSITDGTGQEIVYDDANIATAIGNINITTTGFGYNILASRSNYNLRSNGIVVDATNTVSASFPIALEEPLITKTPVNSDTTTQLNALAQMQRVRNNNSAVRALLEEEVTLRSSAGSGSVPYVGSYYVRPQFIERNFDVTELVQSLGSAQAREDLRGALVMAVANLGTDLYCRSGYGAALAALGYSERDYEIIGVTDCQIAPLMMESGDPRTFGEGVSYRITQSQEQSFADKIYLSLRLKQRPSEPHALDHGMHLYKPTWTANLPVHRQGGTSQEIHTLPANNHYNLLGVLGVINVLNLDSYYLTTPGTP